MRGALLAVVGLCGCSAVVDTERILTDDGAAELELEYETPLYEGLGGRKKSRPVPVVVRGVELDEDSDWAVLTDPYGAWFECDTDQTCLEDGVESLDDDEACCTGPFVGSDGTGVVLVRLPILWDEDSGDWPMTLSLFRGRGMLGRGALEVTLLPQKNVNEGEVLELQFTSPGQRAVFSEIDVAVGGTIALLGTEPARLRVTQQLELDFGPSNELRTVIRTVAGPCTGCENGAPGTTSPLMGGGPGDSGAGGGAVAIQVDGLFDCELPDDVSASAKVQPIVLASSADSTAGGGAIVLSVLGDVEVEEGGPALAAGDTGAVRVMTPSLDGASNPAPEWGPRLVVEPGGRIDSLAGALPVLTDLAEHTLAITGESPDTYYYAVQNGEVITELTATGSALAVTLTPGLNRVCALVRDPGGELPVEVFEKGQCYYSVYLP